LVGLPNRATRATSGVDSKWELFEFDAGIFELEGPIAAALLDVGHH
jgi:hypothetical protein